MVALTVHADHPHPAMAMADAQQMDCANVFSPGLDSIAISVPVAGTGQYVINTVMLR